MQITTYTLMQNKYHVMAAASSPKIGNLELHTLSSSPTPGEGSLLNWKIDSTTKRKLAIVLLLQVQQTSKVEKCARDRIMGIMNFVREAKTKQLFRSLCIEHFSAETRTNGNCQISVTFSDTILRAIEKQYVLFCRHKRHDQKAHIAAASFSEEIEH